MKNTGDNRRVQRVEKEVQSVLGMYLIHGFSQPLNSFVNISKVLMAGDLRNAKVFVSILPKWKKDNEEIVDIKKVKSEKLDSVDEIVDLLNDYAYEFQDKISRELKLRYVPKIKFFADMGTEKIIAVETILNNLENQKTSDKKNRSVDNKD